MQQVSPLPRLGDALVRLAPYLVIILIFLVGLRYAYYSIFSVFRWYDDEGTQMLRVSALIKDPGAYDAVSGPYGPFYYLHKYALHAWLGLPLTHDVVRLTTIVLWGLVAVACAIFVYRLSRSIVLTAVVQMQLILHLRGLAHEPGHPQEIALLLICVALLASSFAADRRAVLPSMITLGFASGALLLVKLNLGVLLAASVAVAMLFSLPRSALVKGVAWTSAACSLTLPAAFMWRHLDVAWGRNYCALVTLIIGSSLVAIARSTEGGELRWHQVAVTAAAAAFTIVSVCIVVLAWGNPFAAILNSVFLRAAAFSSNWGIPARIPEAVVMAGIGSFFVATCYAFLARLVQQHETSRLVVASVKLLYGFFAFYSLYRYGPTNVLQQIIPIPFLWLVVVRTDAVASNQRQFPRVLLCLLAAFHVLQAYPVYATQRAWAVFLLAPLAAICIADGLNTILETTKRFLQWDTGRGHPVFSRTWLAFVLLVLVCVGYYRIADIEKRASSYWRKASLALPGASRLHLQRGYHAQIHWLVKNVGSSCDGFMGMPGFGSLYFWTQIPPPGPLNGPWMLNLEGAHQRAIVEKMRTYERPCIVYNAAGVKAYLRDRPLDEGQPLVRYIRQNFKTGPHLGPYTLLLGNGQPNVTPDYDSQGNAKPARSR